MSLSSIVILSDHLLIARTKTKTTIMIIMIIIADLDIKGVWIPKLRPR